MNIEVSYRPKGCITYVGDTQYDGWTAMILDRALDGTLLDGKGNPLPDGRPPVYLAKEVYPDIDFNELDFGEFVDETELPGVKRTTAGEIWEQMEGGGFSSSINSTFVASRRNRPNVKIILSNAPSQAGYGPGTRIININNDTPHLEQVLMERLSELMGDFMEGRASIVCTSNNDMVFVQLSDSLVECTPNEHGLDSWFDVLRTYVPFDFLEQLAKRLMATYWVDVTVVDGRDGGLLLKRLLPQGF